MDHSAFSLFRRVTTYLRRSDLGFLATAMSPRWYFLDFYVYPPLIVLSLILSVSGSADAGGLAVVWAVALMAFGLLVWTLAEYFIHRYAFHHLPGVMEAHLEHHAEPLELHGSPTVVTVLVFGVLALAPLWYLTTMQSAAAMTAGLMLGYLAYVGVHYAVHHVASLGPRWLPASARLRLRDLIRAHAIHHHQTAYNFGVTTTIWDRVFGTMRRR